jgi:hypothetical protein
MPAYKETHLLTVSGTVNEAKPLRYVHTQEFIAKGSALKIVLTLGANQQIDATIEIARIVGYYVEPSRRDAGAHDVRIFGLYPQTVMNRTTWDFHRDYAKTIYASLERVPADLSGRVPLGLEIELFLEGPNFSSNPTFLLYWEIVVFDVY